MDTCILDIIRNKDVLLRLLNIESSYKMMKSVAVTDTIQKL